MWHGSEWLTGALDREKALSYLNLSRSWRDGEELLPEPAVTGPVGRALPAGRGLAVLMAAHLSGDSKCGPGWT